MKKAISLFLAILSIFGITAIAFNSPTVAKADTALDYKATIEGIYGPFKYEINNGEITIFGCDTNVEGVLEVPAEINGYPVKHIGYNGLAYCKNVTEIVLPDGIETIGNDAFHYCEKLEKINFPDSIRNIFREQFYGTPFYDSKFGENPHWEKHTIYDEENNYTWKEFYVLRIDNHIVSVEGNLGNVYEIPEGIVSIADRAFRDASKNYEVEIVLPSTLVSIGDSSFNDFPIYSNEQYSNVFPLVTKYRVHEDNPYFSSDNDGVLYNKDKTVLIEYPKARQNTEYTVVNTVKEIANNAFAMCKNLETVIMQEPLETVGIRAFSHCEKLLNVTLPDSVKRIKSYAFENTLLMNNFNNDQSEYLYIGNHVISHDSYYNDGLKEGVITFADYSVGSTTYPLIFSDSVVSLGDMNFRRDIKFENTLKIPKNVTYIGDECFDEDSVTYAFEVAEDNSEFSSDEYGVLYNKNKTKLIRYPSHSIYEEYTIPASVKVISGLAFANCQYLKRVDFEKETQIERIDYEAFRFCYSLEEIELPDTIKEIRNYAFVECKNLKNIRLPDNIQRVNGGLDAKYLESMIIPNTEIFLPGGVISSVNYKFKDVYFLGSEEDWQNKIHYRYPIGEEKTDIIIHYNWNSVTYFMDFYVDGVLYESRKFAAGNKTYGEPVAPTKTDYVFVGWDKVVPEVMPAENLIFTAVFNKVSKSDTYDVSASYDTGAFDVEDVTLDVDTVKGEREPGGVYMVEGEYYEQIGLYNIKTVDADAQVVQPNEGYTVTVKMAIPEKYKNRNEFLIYHRFTDGKREKLSTSDGTITVKDGYLIFKVSKFSEFEFFVPSANIRISKLPDKLNYTYKVDNIDLTGIKLTYTNANGEENVITDTKMMTVSGFDNTKTGKQTVTVRYGSYSDTFEVNVSYTWWQIILRIFFLGILWY